MASTAVQFWSVDEVTEYLLSLRIDEYSFSEYANEFRKKLINGNRFLNLSKVELYAIGIVDIAKRDALYHHLKSLKLSQMERSFVFSPDPFSNALNGSCADEQKQQSGKQSYWTSHAIPPPISPLLSPLLLQQPPTPKIPVPPLKDTLCSIPMIPLTPLPSIYGTSSIPIIQSPNAKLFNDTQRLMSQLNFHTQATANPIFNPYENTTNQMNQLQSVNNLIEICGIYQGVNSYGQAWIVLSQQSILSLNAICNKQRNIHCASQQFECKIITEKVPHGWLFANQKGKFPFNPFLKFTINTFNDEIINISQISVNGVINHINDFDQAWISSDLQLDAIEQVTSMPTSLISDIISLKICNISHQSLQQRKASYMIHDPENEGKYKWKQGQKCNFSLKLSTRTNKKNKNTQKPIFVQAYNVEPINEKDEAKY